ncbi:MAG: cupin domain-containing protein [Crenarchaeota archaeon]|nr:cupin domain-containing protein [Thermoproteota archaeon]
MKIAKVENVASFQNPHNVDARKLCDMPGASVTIMSLNPGEGLKKHTTPVDVFFYVLGGKGEVEIGDETQTVEKDTLIESPKNIPHLLRNTGKDPFRFLVVKLK